MTEHVSAETYHADLVADTPTLSASIAKILLTQSPAHARAAHPRLNPEMKKQDASYFDFGNAVHSLFLEDDDSKIRVVMAKDWRKKDVQAERDEIRAAGLTPLLDKDMVRVEAVVKALQNQIPRFSIKPPLFVDGEVERTVVWESQDVLCRTRFDWLHYDLFAIDDLKTTSLSANPQKWSRQLFSMGYDIQAAFYVRAAESMAAEPLPDAPEYRLAIIETEPPYALSVMSLGAAGMALANAKVDRALQIWKRCLAANVWPGYSQNVAYADPPAWAEEQFWASVDADATHEQEATA